MDENVFEIQENVFESIGDLVRGCSKSIVLVLKLLWSCTKSSI